MKQPDYCFYCSKFIRPKFIKRDHFIPRSKRGRNNRANIVMACRSCNVAKGHLNSITCFNLFHPHVSTPDALDNLGRLRATVVNRAAHLRYKAHFAMFDEHPAVRYGDTQIRITDLLPGIERMARSAAVERRISTDRRQHERELARVAEQAAKAAAQASALKDRFE